MRLERRFAGIVLWLSVMILLSGFKETTGKDFFGGQYNSTTGVIISPGYPRHYEHSLHCIYHINVKEVLSLNLTIVDMDTEQCCDVLLLYKGLETTDEPLFSGGGRRKYNGTVIAVNSGIVTIEFTSDTSVTGNGFQIKWSAQGCGNLTNPGNGSVLIKETEYGKVASYACNEGYTLYGESTRYCSVHDRWEGKAPLCKTIVCEKPAPPQNGFLLLNDSTFGSEVYYGCNTGYEVVGMNVRLCTVDGVWSGETPSCHILDCGIPEQTENGYAHTLDTTYGSSVRYYCNDGYILMGPVFRTCTLIDGKPSWSLNNTKCVLKPAYPKYCHMEEDTRGLTWNETISGSIISQSCGDHYIGSALRKCGSEGHWESPVYDCVRESVLKLQSQITALDNDTSPAAVTIVIETLQNVTRPNYDHLEERLTDTELSVISTSLKDVALRLEETELNITDEFADTFFESVSNVVDTSNEESWKSQKENSSLAGNILSAVESFGNALARQLEMSEEENKTIVQANIATEVAKVKQDDIVFPKSSRNNINGSVDDTGNWMYQLESSIRLSTKHIKENGKHLLSTAVLYRDMASIITARTCPNKGSSNSSEINGPVIALSLLPTPAGLQDSLVVITFRHFNETLSDPVCRSWKFDSVDAEGYWSSEGCTLRSSNTTHSVCECNHLTNFAILMSPFVEEVKETPQTVGLEVISLVCISVSLAALVATVLIHLTMWRSLRNDRAVLLMNLCVSLIVTYTVFLAGVDRTQNRVE